MFDKIAALASVATRPNPGVPDVLEACSLLREALKAEDCYVLRAGYPHFEMLGSAASPQDYEVKQKGYWLMWRELATRPHVPGFLFNVEDRLVNGGTALAPGTPCTHFLCILPGYESNDDLLVLRGPWPEGLTREQLDFLLAARPAMTLLVGNVIDAERHARQREQLASMAEIAQAFSEAREIEDVGRGVATALAKASGIDWVLVCLTDESCQKVIEIAGNQRRHDDTPMAQVLPIGEEPVLELARHIRASGRPVLWPDVFSRRLDPALLSYYQQAHVLSCAVLPMVWREKMLGIVYFSSTVARAFEAEEVAFLQGLVSQAATTVAGVQLYRQLEEASRVQHFLARTDGLTGIPNRRYIEEVLRAEAARAERTLEPLSLILADLDNFKEINDRFGHLAGDQALKHVAAIARGSCREADFVGRWGGDEFMFILPGTDVFGAGTVAERFRDGVAVSQISVERARRPVSVSVSAGVAQYGGELLTFGRLVDAADAALYRAKEMGRNRVVLASSPAAAA